MKRAATALVYTKSHNKGVKYKKIIPQTSMVMMMFVIP